MQASNKTVAVSMLAVLPALFCAQAARGADATRPVMEVAQATTQPPAAVAPAAPPAVPTDPTVMRAALVISAPTAPDKVQVYIGGVKWTLDAVTNNPKIAPLELRADVTIPDVKWQVTLRFRKNLDTTLPASHTIELRFAAAAGSPLPAVQQVEAPFMRTEDAASGDPLSGAALQIVPNDFMVALTQGTAIVAQNLGLLSSREWFDFPLKLADGRIAKLTFEKGAVGDLDLDDALNNWK